MLFEETAFAIQFKTRDGQTDRHLPHWFEIDRDPEL